MARKKGLISLDFSHRGSDNLEEVLDKFQKEYRPAEIKRSAFYSETNRSLDKQQKFVDFLEKEKAELQMTYNKARDPVFLRQDAKWLCQFEELLKRQSMAKAIKEEEIHKIKEIDERIRLIDKQTRELQSELLTIRKNRSPVITNDSVIKILESKLYQQSVTYNKTVHKNSIIRRRLQHLLIMRSRFDSLCDRYNKILNSRKDKIGNLCTEALEEQCKTNEIKNELLLLNKNSALQYQKLLSEVQEVSREAKQKGRLLPFMMKKQKSRAGHLKGPEAKKEKIDTAPEEQLKLCQNIYQDVKRATQQTEAKESVKYFIQGEERNFKLFNYANELRDENEHIQQRIRNLEKKLDEARMRGERCEEEFAATKEKLEKTLREAEAKDLQLKEKIDLCYKTFNDLKVGIVELYNKSGCSDEYFPNVLCIDQGVTRDNILVFLATLESWISDLLLFSDYLTYSAKDNDQASAEINKPVTSMHDAYSRLSTASGSITPSIRTSLASFDVSPEVQNIKMLPFPKFHLPELRKLSSSDAKVLQTPYTRSEVQVAAAQMVEDAGFTAPGSEQIFVKYFKPYLDLSIQFPFDPYNPIT